MEKIRKIINIKRLLIFGLLLLVGWYVFLCEMDGPGVYIGRAVNKVVNPSVEKKTTNESCYKQGVDALFESDENTTIYIKGDKISFEEYKGNDYNGEVKVEYVSEIDNKLIKQDMKQNIIIFNNLSGNVSISREELIVLKNATNNKNFTFYYVGDEQFEQFVEAGIFNESAKQEDDICVANEYYDGGRLFMSGIYTIHDDEVLSKGTDYSGLDDCIMINTVRIINSNKED